MNHFTSWVKAPSDGSRLANHIKFNPFLAAHSYLGTQLAYPNIHRLIFVLKRMGIRFQDLTAVWSHKGIGMLGDNALTQFNSE